MKIQIKHSTQLSGSSAVAPVAQYMLDGELALNFNATDPRLFAKLSNGSIGNIPIANHTNSFWHQGNDGAGSGLDADLLDGQQGSYYWNPSNDGAGSGLDADLLDGQQGSYFLNYNNFSNTPTIPTNNNQLTNGAGYVTSSGNTTIGTSNNLNTSGANIIDFINVTDGVITQMGQRTLTLADLGYTGATNANYITNNNQISNGAGYVTSSAIPTNNNQLTNGAGYITSASLGSYLPLTGGTLTGELQVNARLDVGNGSNANHEIRIYKGDNDVSDHIQFYNGTTRVGEIGCRDDTWLRINNDTAKNIYTPRYIRADGGFFVDGTTKGINGSGNFIGGTIAGASDYSTLVRSNASDTLTGGTYTYSSSTDEKIILQGSTNPYIRFQESTTDKAYIQWSASLGELILKNQEHDRKLVLSTTSNNLLYYRGNFLYKVWEAGNDGSGSGLDADTVDGIQGASFLRSDANDVIGGVLSYHSDTARLQFRNTSYNTYLYIGGWDGGTNSAGVSRIRGSNDNLHLDSGANGNLYLNHYSTGTIYARGQTVWHAGNDGSGSGLDADNLDGYSWTSSGKNLRGTEIYADNWFRNYNNGEGLYNEANAMYWYSDSNARWRLRSNQGTAQIIFATSSNAVRGYVYANNSNNIGFLDSDGAWAVRVVRDSYVELRDNDEVTFRAGQGGVDGNYGTVSTHGGGKGGWEGYSINGRYVFMSADNERCGIYNDIDNEWMAYFVRNGSAILYHNGSECFKTQSSSSATIGGSTVWHAGNDGSGSGLDADTLDGVSSGSFLRSDESDSFSGTINGSGSLAIARSNSYSPGAGNTNTGIVLRYTGVAYFSYGNGVTAVFNRNNNGDLVSWRRSGTEEGSIEINTSRVYYRTTSDYRRKNNVTPIANGIDVIKALNPSSYNWIEDNRLDHGFLAHEIQEHIPGSASGYKDEVDEEGEPVYQKVDLTTVVPFLTAALKDSIARIESLEATVAALQNT